MNILKEIDYKCITIDWLLAKGELQGDAVLINELPVDSFARRADIVVANGKLQAFEIKSDADSLVRLQGQINTYLRFFDKVTLVCSPKFSKRALELLPESVEVLELVKRNGKHTLKYKRRGQTKLVSSHKEFLSFATKRYLVQFLRSNGIEANAKDSHFTIYQKAALLPKSVWRTATLNYLKDKYKTTFQNFIENRSDSDFTLDKDIENLSVQKLLDRNPDPIRDKTEQGVGWESWEPSNLTGLDAVDVSAQMAHHGFVTKGPVMLIPRAS
ncbi:sce7726 family protein [Shewanella sp.]|uniref:sce7726 family protein n=2 Tax=Shewanella sp. TaxID=50422 RepID=UPI00405409AA